MGTNILFSNCEGIRPKRKELDLYLKDIVTVVITLNKTLLNKSTISKCRVMILSEMTAQLAFKEVLPSL